MDKLDFTFLPESVSAPLSRIGTEKLYEIRMRAGAPVVVNHDNKRLFLGRERLTTDAGEAIFCDRELIEETLFRAADYSLYAANESLKSGFVTTRGGVRVGVCGECVFDGKNIVTIKNFTSLCIRIPHFIEGAANELIRRAFADGVKNTLIVSAPGYGKTTILKDLCRVFAENYNVLVIDERGELEDERLAKADIVKFSDKLYAFQYGIRSLAPQIVMTDELSGKEELGMRAPRGEQRGEDHRHRPRRRCGKHSKQAGISFGIVRAVCCSALAGARGMRGSRLRRGFL